MKKKKIHQKNELIIFHPSIEGAGVEKNLFIIANYLSKKIKKISLISADKKPDKFSKKIKLITPFFDVKNSIGRPFKYFVCLLILIFKILSNYRNCVVLSFQANIYAIIICIIFKIKIISRSNSSPSGWSKDFFKNIVFNFFLKRADEVIVNSVDFKKELDRKFNIKSKMILNPFNFSFIKAQSKKKVDLKFFKKDSLKIINVARMTDQKNHFTLIKSIALANKKRNVQAIIVGRGILQEEIKNTIKKYNLEKKILLVGYQNNPYKYMKHGDIFVLTSIFEGHPNVLIEAQYLQKFIISSDCPTGPREILNNGKYGALFKTGNYKQLANILIKYRYNKKIKKKINNGFKTLKIYDYNKNCEAYYNIVKSYLN